MSDHRMGRDRDEGGPKRAGGRDPGRWRRWTQRTERILVDALRSPVARWAGLAVGLIAFGLFVATLISSGERARQLLGDGSLVALVPGLVGLAGFEVAAIVALRGLGARSSGTVWASSQLSKYLPVPASAAFGMMGSSVRAGHTPRDAFGLLVRHSILLVGTATVVGAPAVGTYISGAAPGWGTLAGSVIAVGGIVVSTAVLRNADTIRKGVLAGGAGLAGWLLVALGMGLSFGDDLQTALLLGAAYCAAWVAGQIVIPVPAGLGVREFALVAMLAPTLGRYDALSFAVLSRVLHVVADGLLAVSVLVIARRLGGRRADL